MTHAKQARRREAARQRAAERARLARRRRRITWASAAALVVALAGLVGWSMTSGGSDAGPAAGSGQPTEDSQGAQVLAYYQCLRDAGYDVADPENLNQVTVPEGVDPEDPAVQECRSLLPMSDMANQPPDAARLDAMRAFTQCMRDNGVDMADPDPASGSLSMEGIDNESPEFQAAVQACQEVLAGQPVIMGGPPQ